MPGGKSRTADLSTTAELVKAADRQRERPCSIALITPPCPWSSGQTNPPKGVPYSSLEGALLAVNLLHFLFAEDDPASRPVAFLYECAGSRCYATEQPKGGDTPYVQMLRIFHSNNYHVELITNCRAYDYGNPTGRPRAFVMAYLADPGEELLCPSDAKAIIDATP